MSGALEIGGKPFEAFARRNAAKSQRKADLAAMERQLEFLEGRDAEQTELAREGQGIIGAGTRDALTRITTGAQDTLGAIGVGGQRARLALDDFSQQGRDALREGTSEAQSSLRQLTDRQLGEFDTGRTAALQRFDQAGGTLQDFAGRVDVGAPIEESPEFQFAMDQALKGVNAGFSARGGRLGGRAAKALQDRAQGVASQYAGEIIRRRLAQRGQDIGVGSTLAGIQQGQGGIELQTAGQRAGSIGAAGFQDANLTAQQGRILNQGFGSQGAQSANIELGVGNQRANTLMGLTNNAANIITAGASNEAAALQGLAQQKAGIASQTLPLFQIPTQTAGINQLAMLDVGGGINQGIGSVGGVVEGAAGRIGGRLAGGTVL